MYTISSSQAERSTQQAVPTLADNFDIVTSNKISMNAFEKDAAHTRFDLVISDVAIIGIDYNAKPCMVGDSESIKFRVVCGYQDSLNQGSSFSSIDADERKPLIDIYAFFVGSTLNFDGISGDCLIYG